MLSGQLDTLTDRRRTDRHTERQIQKTNNCFKITTYLSVEQPLSNLDCFFDFWALFSDAKSDKIVTYLIWSQINKDPTLLDH